MRTSLRLLKAVAVALTAAGMMGPMTVAADPWKDESGHHRHHKHKHKHHHGYYYHPVPPPAVYYEAPRYYHPPPVYYAPPPGVSLNLRLR